MSEADVIRAGIERREALARAATAGAWHWTVTGSLDAGDYDTVIEQGPVSCMAYCYGGSSTLEVEPQDREHIAANDPAHVLAVLAAAREELADALAQQERHKASGSHCPVCPGESSAEQPDCPHRMRYCRCNGSSEYPCPDARQAARTIARLLALYGATA